MTGTRMRGTLLVTLGMGSVAATIVPNTAQSAEGADMVRIEGGTYMIGSDEARPSAAPAHRVTLEPFLIGRYEVTNAQFARFLNTLELTPASDTPPSGPVEPEDVRGPEAARLFEIAEGSDPDPVPWVALDDEHSRIGIEDGRFVPQPGYADHPVNEVTWYGARAFCAWRGARLPSEVEWEAAARGHSARQYPWGGASPTAERAVFDRRSNQTVPVGAHPAGATPTGIHDLAGNVAEWTSSLYEPYPYDAGDDRESPAVRGERVTRGGDHVFDSAPSELTVFYRAGFSRKPDRGHRHIGFRCADQVTPGTRRG